MLTRRCNSLREVVGFLSGNAKDRKANLKTKLTVRRRRVYN